MKSIGNDLSFKGKYAIYGDKQKVSQAVTHIAANKKENVDFFPISSSNRALVIVATDKDVLTLKSKKSDSDFIENIKKCLLSKDLFKRVQNLFNYIFSSHQDVPVLLDSEVSKIGTRFNKFDYTTGQFVDNSSSTVFLANGTYKKYSSSGNIVEQKFEDGSIRKNSSKGYIVEYPNGTYKQFTTNGNLKEEKFEDGSIEMYRHAGGKQLLQTKIFPSTSPDIAPIVRNYLYNSNVLTYITESTGKIAKVDKDGNQTWLPIDENKIGEGFSEEFKDLTTLVRNYSDGSKDTYKCGQLSSTVLSDKTRIYYHKNEVISQIRKIDGTVEYYDEQANLVKITDIDGLLKEFNVDGNIIFERLSVGLKRYTRYVNSEPLSFVVKSGEIQDTTGTVSEDKKNVTFSLKNGSTVTFDYLGYEVKPSKKTERKSTQKTISKQSVQEPILPKFVSNSLKVGAVVDYEKKTVSFLRNNDIIDIYNFDGKLLVRRFPNGDEQELDEYGNVLAETTPLGKRVEYYRGAYWDGDYKKVTNIDGSVLIYDRNDRLKTQILEDGTEIKFNHLGLPVEKILPSRKRGTYHYEQITNKLLFISYTDNSIVSETGEVDTENQTVSFLQSDGSKHIYSSNGKLIAIKLKNGVTNILDENQKLKEKVYPNGTRAFYDTKGHLTSKLYKNGIIEEYNIRGVITKITDATGDTYEYYYGKLIKAPRNILIRNQKQRNLYNSARQSFISTIAWKLSPETRAGQSEHAKGDAYLASIIEKKNFNQKLNQALKFSRAIDYSEPMEISQKENIKYLSYLKRSWDDVGVEEFSLGVSAAYELFKQYVEYGVDSIQDVEVRQAVQDWIRENPDKNNVILYSKK